MFRSDTVYQPLTSYLNKVFNKFCKFPIFLRKFGTKCSGCGHGIPPTDAVRRAHNNVYHLKCFMCRICHIEFQTGDDFYLMDDKKLICKTDYENAKAKGNICLKFRKFIGHQKDDSSI